MQQCTRVLTVSIIACALPGALAVLAVTFSPVWSWNRLSFIRSTMIGVQPMLLFD